jgi:hypothetical protein
VWRSAVEAFLCDWRYQRLVPKMATRCGRVVVFNGQANGMEVDRSSGDCATHAAIQVACVASHLGTDRYIYVADNLDAPGQQCPIL